MSSKRKRPKAPPKKKEWTETDFVKNLSQLMDEQLSKNPLLKRVYDQLEPDFPKITDKIQKLFEVAKDQEDIFIEELLALKDKAVVPLIEFLLKIKKITRDS